MEPALTISGGEFSVSCFLLETKNENSSKYQFSQGNEAQANPDFREEASSSRIPWRSCFFFYYHFLYQGKINFIPAPLNQTPVIVKATIARKKQIKISCTSLGIFSFSGPGEKGSRSRKSVKDRGRTQSASRGGICWSSS